MSTVDRVFLLHLFFIHFCFYHLKSEPWRNILDYFNLTLPLSFDVLLIINYCLLTVSGFRIFLGRKADITTRYELASKSSVNRTYFHGRRLVRKLKQILVALHEDKIEEQSQQEAKQLWSANLKLVEEECQVTDAEQRSTTKLQNFSELPAEGKIIGMPDVKPTPRNTYWVKIEKTVISPDSQYLTHLPQLPENFRCKKAFYNKLVEFYEDSEDSDVDLRTSNPRILKIIIVALSVLEDHYGPKIFEEQLNRDNVYIYSLDLYHLADLCYHYMDDSKVKSCNPVISPLVFSTVTSAEIGAGPLETLAEWFRREINEIPAPVEVENDLTNVYEVAFCRICQIYGCSYHFAIVEDKMLPLTLAVIGQDCSDTGNNEVELEITCTFSNCINKMTSPGTRAIDEEFPLPDTAATWSYEEKSLFNALRESIHDDCAIASILRTKTCRQVQSMRNEICSPSKMNSKAEPGTKAKREAVEIYQPRNSDSEVSNAKKTCSHKGLCSQVNCSCFAKGIPCQALCSCSKSCLRRIRGCKCKKACNSKLCPCYAGGYECDPTLCFGCGSNKDNVADMTCRNVSIQRRLGKHVKAQKSSVEGWGAFAGVEINAGELISEYVGELISQDEADRRGHVYDMRKQTFLFELNEDFVIDAIKMGNESRFINSSKSRRNCMPRTVWVNGEQRMGIYAIKNIKAGDELFFDYQEIINKNKNKKRRIE